MSNSNGLDIFLSAVYIAYTDPRVNITSLRGTFMISCSGACKM